MTLYVRVEADTNDADYVEKFSQVRDGHVTLIRKVAEAVGACTAPYNWPSSEYVDGSVEEVYAAVLTEEDVDAFCDYIPQYGHEVHTIETIQFINVTDIDVLI